MSDPLELKPGDIPVAPPGAKSGWTGWEIQVPGLKLPSSGVPRSTVDRMLFEDGSPETKDPVVGETTGGEQTSGEDFRVSDPAGAGPSTSVSTVQRMLTPTDPRLNLDPASPYLPAPSWWGSSLPVAESEADAISQAMRILQTRQLPNLEVSGVNDLILGSGEPIQDYTPIPTAPMVPGKELTAPRLREVAPKEVPAEDLSSTKRY